MEKNVEKNIIILSDKDGKNEERPWLVKKNKSLKLYNSYFRLGLDKKALRVKECGTFLEFKRYHDNSLKLNYANFCKDRLCPLCSWRRSLKIFGQTSKIMDKALEEKKYRFLFLTLTAKNCESEDLSNQLTSMFKAFNYFTRRKQIKDSIVGWFRALEVTHNVNINSKDFNTFHPHFHVILMVNNSYFKKKELYLKQKDFTSLWEESLGVDYTPIVHIEAFKNSTSKAVAEATKYTVKDGDYLIEDDEEFTDNTVKVLAKALKGRRLTALGGRLKEISKELKMDDMVDGDLVHTDSQNLESYDEEHMIDKDTGELVLREDVEYVLEKYFWHIGYSNYVKK